MPFSATEPRREALTREFIEDYLRRYGPPPDPVPAKAPAQQNNRYAEHALRDELATLAAAQVGNRDNQLFLSSRNLSELIAGGVLAPDGVEDALLATARQLGLDDREATKAIRSGMTTGSKTPRIMPERLVADPAPSGPELDHETIIAVVEGSAPRVRFHSAWPYGIEGTTLVRYVKNKDGEDMPVTIADFAATIVEEVTTEEGDKTFVIEGDATRGGPFRLEVEATLFGQDSKLRAALEAATGARDPVRADQTKHLAPAIKLLTRDESLVQIRRYRRTGWLGNVFLLPGREQAHTRIDLPHKLPYAGHPLGAEADFDDACTALTHLLDAIAPTLSTPILAMLLQAPLHRVAGWHNERYGMFVQGRTGTLKTSWCQTAMCLYGPGFAFSDNLIKWGEGATRNAIMAMATHVHDLPLLIDNYKPNTGGGERDFVNLIHNILEGGEKDRLTRAAELRETQPVHCFPLITGEDVPSTDPASLARVLVLKFEWQHGEANDALTYAQDHSDTLCAVGEAWIAWLETDEGRAVIESIAPELNDRRTAWAAYLRAQRTDMVNILRVATSLAVNELTWRIACLHPTLGDLLNAYTADHRRGLETIAATMADQTTESLGALRYLDALRELVTTGQYLLIARPVGYPTDIDRDRMLGWRDSDGVYLLPKLALHAVKRLLGPGELTDSPQTLYAQMAGLGLLVGTGTEKTTKLIRVQNSIKRVLHLRPDVFDPVPEVAEAYSEELGL